MAFDKDVRSAAACMKMHTWCRISVCYINRYMQKGILILHSCNKNTLVLSYHSNHFIDLSTLYNLPVPIRLRHGSINSFRLWETENTVIHSYQSRCIRYRFVKTGANAPFEYIGPLNVYCIGS